MTRYALIVNGKVDLVVTQDSTPGIAGTWIQTTNAGPGWTYDGTFHAPVSSVKRYISVGSFFDRFGAYKYPILASTDVSVQALIKDCSVRSYIDLDNPQLPTGLGIIISAGYSIDSDAIINGSIADHETPSYRMS